MLGLVEISFDHRPIDHADDNQEVRVEGNHREPEEQDGQQGGPVLEHVVAGQMGVVPEEAGREHLRQPDD